MNNKNVLKIIAGTFVVLDFILIFLSVMNRTDEFVPFNLFGRIIGWGIALFFIQKFFQWILNKARVEQSGVIGLIIAAAFYAVVFFLFTFIA